MKTKLVATPVPVEFMWEAQDHDGQWFGYINEPTICGEEWVCSGDGSFISLGRGDPNPNWKDTLRPLAEIRIVDK